MKIPHKISFFFSQLNLRIFFAVKCTAVLLVCSMILQAQPYHFKHISLEDGLIQSSIQCIHQDSRGFVWIGTEDGLHKYDGYEFKYFRHIPEDPTSLSNNFVNCIEEDTYGNLWIGTRYGLNLLDYKTDSIKHFFAGKGTNCPSGNTITSLALDYSDNSVWIGLHNGVDRLVFDVKKRNSFSFQNKVLPLMDKVLSLFLDSKSDLWIGTRTGLFHTDRNTMLTIKINYDKDKWIYSIAEDTNGFIWVGCKEFVAKIHRGSVHGKLKKVDLGKYDDNVGHPFHLVQKDALGNLWIGSKMGLLKKDIKSDEFILIGNEDSHPHVLKSHHFYSMMLDDSGMHWFGTSWGISQINLNEQRFPLYVLPDPLKKGKNVTNIRAVFEDHSSTVWAGATGLFRKSANEKTFVSFEGIPGTFNDSIGVIRSIAEDLDNNLWLGSSHKGLVKIDKNRVHIEQKRIGTNRVDVVFVDREGFLWTGYINELIRYNPTNDNIERVSLKSTSNLKCFAQDSTGTIWLGTFGDGLFRFDPKQFATPAFKLEPYIIAGKDSTFQGYSFINLIVPDVDNTLWLGTYGGGIVKIKTDDNEFSFFHSDNTDLPNDIIYALLKDENGLLWVSSNKGVCQFNPKDSSAWMFDMKDGLQSNEFNLGVCFKSGDKLYFGGSFGFNELLPGQIIKDDFEPPLVFTAFYLNDTIEKVGNSILNEVVSEASEIVLNHQQNSFGFKFSALDFNNPGKNNYKYRMVGLDEGWLNIGTRREKFFTNLSPGNYRFEVMGTNHDGKWSKSIVSIKIKINPPWYWNKLAWAIYLILIFNLFYWLYRARLSTKLKYAERIRLKDLEIAENKRLNDLEHAENVRLKELNEVKNHFYTNITHEFRTPLTVIIGLSKSMKKYFFGKNKELLEHQSDLIIRNGRELLNLVNQMLERAELGHGDMQPNWQHGNIVPVLKYVGESFESFAKHKHIKLSVYNEVEEIYMDYDERKLLRIISNLLSNAIEHVQKNGKVVLHIKEESADGSPQLVLKVRDNGEGIPEEELPHVFEKYYKIKSNIKSAAGTGLGLALAKEVTEILGGKITVDSERGKWTEFVVRFPILHNYEGAERQTDIREETDLYMLPMKKIKKVGRKVSHPEGTPIILVVEDNEDLSEYLAQNLNLNFRVEIAVNGQAGIDKALELIPDIIICDVMMEEKDGFEVCKYIKNDERTSHIPVLMLTARVTEKDRLRGLKAGAIDYLTKPFLPDELNQKIENIFFVIRNQQRVNLNKLEGKNEESEKFLHLVNRLLKENLSNENFDVNALSRALDCSRSTAYRKVKALTGMSIKDLRADIRLKEARRLLQTTKLTLAQIALKVGYSTEGTLSDAYFRKFDERPSATRK